MSACTPAILTRIADSTAFAAWKTTTSMGLSGISTNAKGGGIPPTPAEQAALVEAETDIFNTVNCLQEKVSQLSSTTNTIQKAQQQVLSLNDQIKNEEANVAIARDRVAYIRNPEQHTSFYESWFPMDRPMRTGSVPIFIGVTIFLMIFCLLVILSVMGINVTFAFPQVSAAPSPFLRIVGRIRTLEWILIIVLISVVIYFMNRK
jgi:hypothetical protein